jgi:cell division protein FtsB
VDNQLSVPTDAVLGVVSAQRNSALDELAKAQVVVEQLVAERDRLAAEVERLSGEGAGETV